MVSNADAVYAYAQTNMVSTIASLFLFLVMFFAIVSLFESKSKKTKKYREAFADLYVIGMVRKFAKEDGIDLDKEMIEIRRLEKLEKVDMRSIDRTIEAELNEKISAANQEKIKEIQKKV